MPDRICTSIRELDASLTLQLKPLSEIPQAIVLANEAAIGPVKEIFIESRKEWKETLTKLGKQSSKTAEAIEHLESPINALTEKIGQITDLVNANEQAVNRINARSEEVAVLLTSIQDRVDSVVTALSTVASQMGALPSSVREQLQSASTLIINSVREYYEGLGREYETSVRDLAAASTADITTASVKAAASIELAADSLRISADSMTPEIRTAIKDGADLLGTQLDTFNRAFSEHFPGAVERLAQTLSTASEHIATAQGVLGSMAASASQSAEHAKAWSEVEQRLASVQAALSSDVDRLTTLGTQIENSAKLHASLSPIIQETTTTFQDVSRGLREVARKRRNGKTHWLGRLFGRESDHYGA